jgi:hypothetical protein
MVLVGSLLQPIGALSTSGPDHGEGEIPEAERVRFGRLPVARRDIERLRHVLTTVPKLLDPMLPPRAARGLPHRPSFADAVLWLEIFGRDPAAVEPWKNLLAEQAPRPPAAGSGRRRRRRGRGRGAGTTGLGQTEQPGNRQESSPPAKAPDGGAGDGTKPRRRRRRRRR